MRIVYIVIAMVSALLLSACAPKGPDLWNQYDHRLTRQPTDNDASYVAPRDMPGDRQMVPRDNDALYRRPRTDTCEWEDLQDRCQ